MNKGYKDRELQLAKAEVEAARRRLLRIIKAEPTEVTGPAGSMLAGIALALNSVLFTQVAEGAGLRDRVQAFVEKEVRRG